LNATARLLPEASPRAVIASMAGLDAELAERLAEACAHAGATMVRWSDQASPPPGGLVLAALSPGERHIPDRLMTLARDRPAATLLLLCREALVRPSVTLQDGRVILVEAPFSVRRLASRIRVALAAGNPSRDSATRELQRPGHWVGLVSGPRFPAWLDEGPGVTVVVGAAAPPHPGARLRELLDRGEEASGALPALLGEGAGLVHLTPRRDEWVLFWPSAARPLWLCSTVRLPPCWDLGVTAQDSPGRCLRLPATGGDVVVALPGDVGDWALGAASPGVPGGVSALELIEAAADGGPALLETVTERMPGGALVVEAR
jgi:hypothetical protein